MFIEIRVLKQDIRQTDSRNTGQFRRKVQPKSAVQSLGTEPVEGCVLIEIDQQELQGWKKMVYSVEGRI